MTAMKKQRVVCAVLASVLFFNAILVIWVCSQPLESTFCNRHWQSNAELHESELLELKCERGHLGGESPQVDGPGPADYNTEMSEKFATFHLKLKEYKEFHDKERRKLVMNSQVSADQTVRTLTWFCLDGCNGIGDRVKGMYTVLLLAIMTQRVFLVFESEAVQDSMYLEPNLIDWRYHNSCLKMNKKNALLGCAYNGTKSEYIRRVFSKDADYQHLSITHQQYPFGLIHEPPRLHSNVVPPYSKWLEEQLQKLGIASATNAEYFHYLYPVMNHYLFKLPQLVLEGVNSAMSSLELSPQGYVAVHIRTGFKNSWFGEIEFSEGFRKGWRYARSEEAWRGILKCAVDVADAKFGANSSLFMCADDKEPKQLAVDLYGDRIKMLDTKPAHVGRWLYGSGSHESLLDNWVELGVLALSHSIVKVTSGFSDVATRFCGMPPENKYLFYLSNSSCSQGAFKII